MYFARRTCSFGLVFLPSVVVFDVLWDTQDEALKVEKPVFGAKLLGDDVERAISDVQTEMLEGTRQLATIEETECQIIME